MKKKRYAGFTLIEMMIVLLIISVLILLFIPNLSKEKESIVKKGDEALVEAMRTQIELAAFSQEGILSEEAILAMWKDDPNREKKIELYHAYIKGK